MPHGNSHQNGSEHHLYEIRDEQEKEVFKYGISDDLVGQDGLSKRIKVQLSLLNLAAGWLRYFGNVIVTGIPGRKRAEQIEKDHIDAFEAEHGQRPRGNPRRIKKPDRQGA
ncbi:MAG: hypothetical protein ACKVUS_06490 [Saprospiraceae bacterium]